MYSILNTMLLALDGPTHLSPSLRLSFSTFSALTTLPLAYPILHFSILSTPTLPIYHSI